MNKDDVIRIAKEAGATEMRENALSSDSFQWACEFEIDELAKFAEIVRNAERRKHQAEIEMWKAQAAQAEKWRGMALAKDPMQPGKVVQEIQREAAAYEREACAQLCEQSDRYRGSYFAQKIRERGE